MRPVGRARTKSYASLGRFTCWRPLAILASQANACARHCPFPAVERSVHSSIAESSPRTAADLQGALQPYQRPAHQIRLFSAVSVFRKDVRGSHETDVAAHSVTS